MNELLTQKTLIQRLQENPCDTSWDEFVHYYSGYIYVIIRNMNVAHHDAEDLKQQALVKTWKGLPKFVYTPREKRFRSWLCTIVKNTVRSYLKLRSTRMNKLSESEQATEEGYLACITLPEVETIAEEEWEHYVANLAMSTIRERFQPQVIRAFELFCEGKAAQSVADEMQLPLNTVHVYKKRVQNALYKEIVRLDNDLS